MVEVKVAQDQVRVGEKRKNPLRQYAAVGRVVCAKKVDRSDPEGVVWGSEKSVRRENINRNHL